MTSHCYLPYEFRASRFPPLTTHFYSQTEANINLHYSTNLKASELSVTWVNKATTKHCVSQKLFLLALQNPWQWMLKPVTFTGNSPTSDLWRYTNLTQCIYYKQFSDFVKKAFSNLSSHLLSSLKDKQDFKNLMLKCESKEQYWVQNQLDNLQY